MGFTKREREINAISAPTNVILNAFFIVYSLLCIGPLLLVIIVSVTDAKSLAANGFSLFPEKVTLLAYKFIMDSPKLVINAYSVSIFVTVVGTVLGLLMTSMLAYPLSRKDFRYRNAISFYLFFTMLFNGGLVPWFILYKNYLHLYDSAWALIIPYLVNAWNILIMKTFFSMNVPVEVIESAKIDGASEIRIFFSIVTRLSLPAFATLGLFSTLGYWNDWWLSLLFISSESKMPLQYVMYRTMRNIQALSDKALQVESVAGVKVADIPEEGVRMAMAVIGIGPIIFAYPFFQKYFIKGLTVGAVKG